MVKVTKLEKDFFSFLKSQFSKNDYIKIDKSLVPKNLSNSVNRFYNENLTCFSRIKVSGTKSIYYFGLKDQNKFNIKFLLKFNSNSISSTIIRFHKNNVYISVKVLKDSKEYNKIKKFFSLTYSTKDKKDNFYYINLGSLNSKDLIKNIEFLLDNFDFDLNLSNNYLYILEDISGDFSFDEIEFLDNNSDNLNPDTLKYSNLSLDDIEFLDKDFDNLNFADFKFLDEKLYGADFDRFSSDYSLNKTNLELLEFNLSAFNIKEIINKKELNFKDKDKLNRYIFNTMRFNNLEFSENIDVNKDDEKIFEIIYNSIFNCNTKDLNFILKNMISNLESGNVIPIKNKVEKNNLEKDRDLSIEEQNSERILMEKVLKLYAEGKSGDEIFSITGIENYQIEKWYEDYVNNPNENNKYFHEELDKIKNSPLRIKKLIDQRKEATELSDISDDQVSTQILDGKKDNNQNSIYSSFEYGKKIKNGNNLIKEKEYIIEKKSKLRNKIEIFLNAYRESKSFDVACVEAKVSPVEFRRWMLATERNLNDDFIYLNSELNKINEEIYENDENQIRIINHNSVDVDSDEGVADLSYPSELNDELFEYNIDLTEYIINEIISNIDLSNSEFIFNNLNENDINKLIFDLDSYTSNIMFKFSTKQFNDTERNCIIDKIKLDINQKFVSGNISDIVSYYLDEYSYLKNKFISNKYLDEFIKSEPFNTIVNKYNIDDSDVGMIIDKVKNDISTNNLTSDAIQTKFEIYFNGFKLKNEQYDELEKLKNNKQKYMEEENLTEKELNDIFDSIENMIDKNYGDMNSASFYLRKEIENKKIINQSNARKKLSSFSFNKLKNNLMIDEYEILINNVEKLIYNNELRSEEINENYLLKLSKEL